MFGFTTLFSVLFVRLTPLVPTSATHLTKEKGFGKHEGFLLFIRVNAGDPGLTTCRCATGQRLNVDRFLVPDNVCSN